MSKKVKVLRSRRKKASKGRAIRVSDEVYNYLAIRRQDRMSWDCYLRKVFGLDDRDGNSQKLLEGWLEQNTGLFFLDLAEAKGAAVVAAAKSKTDKVKKPIKMREVV